MVGVLALAALVGIAVGCLIAWALLAPKLSAARAEIASFRQQLDAALARESEHARIADQERQRLERELAAKDERIAALLEESAALKTQVQTLHERLEEDRAYREELQRQLRLEFEQMATRILEQRSTLLKEQSTETLEKTLAPLRERIAAFEEKIDRAYTEHTKGTASLREQLQQLFQLNARLTEQADTLATALRGDKRLQGSWGEVQLERLLELSGLQRDVEYKVQVSTRTSEGDRIRPDVVVYLPEGKHLVVDSKVSLSAYAAFIEASTDGEREQHLRHHVQAVRQHIERLASKDYYAAEGIHSPEFVLLFMPIEAALSVALHADRELYTFAWERRIVLTSPTTLLATLRTVASVWKHERHNRNALMIAEEAGKLYDKLASVLDDLMKVGETLERTKRDYENAMNRLCRGSGNVIARAQRLVELGAKAKKQLDRRLLSDAGGSDPESTPPLEP
jgi:DNA recombination protein RmuC